MPDTSNVLKAPTGGRYDRGWCEPDPQGPKQCIDKSIRVPKKLSKRPARDDRFVRGLNPLISEKIQKKMKNPAWRARQIALLRAEMKDDTPTVGKFFGNMLKIAALPFALLGAGCVFDKTGLPEPDGTVQPDVARHDAGDAEVIDDGAVDGATDGTTPVDGSPDADATVVVDDRPTITLPSLSTLPNNRAFVRWNPPSETEPGKTVVGYQVSWSDGSNNYNKEVTFPFTAIDILSPNTMHTITVRARYDDASYGQSSTQAQVVADTSLMARYTMDEGAGTMIMDDSGNGNHGTLVNFDPLTAWTQGIIGTGLLFDGVDSHVDTGDTFNFDSTDPFTIEAWVKRTAVGFCSAMFNRMDQTDSSLYRGYWLGFRDTSEIQFSLNSNFSADDRLRVMTSSSFASVNSPLNVALTYDGLLLASGVNVYANVIGQAITVVDDDLVGTTVNTAPSRIGAGIADGGPIQDTSCVVNGIIDDLAVYGRALSADEVLNNNCAREALHSEEVGDASSMPVMCN